MTKQKKSPSPITFYTFTGGGQPYIAWDCEDPAFVFPMKKIIGLARRCRSEAATTNPALYDFFTKTLNIGKEPKTAILKEGDKELLGHEMSYFINMVGLIVKVADDLKLSKDEEDTLGLCHFLANMIGHYLRSNGKILDDSVPSRKEDIN